MSEEHRIILGTTTLDRLLVSGAESGLNQHQTADKLLEWGFFRFDTAQNYGHGQQEAYLGRMLANAKRDQYEVITKIMSSEMKSRGSFFDAIYISLKMVAVWSCVKSLSRFSDSDEDSYFKIPVRRSALFSLMYFHHTFHVFLRIDWNLWLQWQIRDGWLD